MGAYFQFQFFDVLVEFERFVLNNFPTTPFIDTPTHRLLDFFQLPPLFTKSLLHILIFFHPPQLLAGTHEYYSSEFNPHWVAQTELKSMFKRVPALVTS